MSLEEKNSMRDLDYIIRLWLSENFNHYILEKVTYGNIKAIKSSPGNYSYKYTNGFFFIRERYSKVRMRVRNKEVYKWMKWRNNEMIQARYNWLETRPEMQEYSSGPSPYPYSIDFIIQQQVIKTMKGFN